MKCFSSFEKSRLVAGGKKKKKVHSKPITAQPFFLSQSVYLWINFFVLFSYLLFKSVMRRWWCYLFAGIFTKSWLVKQFCLSVCPSFRLSHYSVRLSFKLSKWLSFKLSKWLSLQTRNRKMLDTWLVWLNQLG
jgi:hypothetical protein